MYDTENPDYEDWNPDTDSQHQVPDPQRHNQGVLPEGDEHKPNEEVEKTKQLIQETRPIEWLQFWVNAILAAVGIVAIVIYLGQLCAMNKTLREIQKQTPEIQKQAKAAQDQLAQAKAESIASGIATDQQLAIMQRQLTQQGNAMRLDQRAWVTVTAVQLTDALKVGEEATLTVNTKNSGKTPALDVHDYSTIVARPTIAEAISGEIAGKPVSSAIFEAGGTGKLIESTSQPFKQGHIDAIQSGRTTLYAVGRICYRDIFDVQRETRYCFQVQSDDMIKANALLGACAQGNVIESDESAFRDCARAGRNHQKNKNRNPN